MVIAIGHNRRRARSSSFTTPSDSSSGNYGEELTDKNANNTYDHVVCSMLVVENLFIKNGTFIN